MSSYRFVTPVELGTRLGPGLFCRSVGCWEKLVRIEGTPAQPDQPEGFQDLALRVEPGVAHAPGSLLARLVKLLIALGPVVDLQAVRQA